MMGLDVNGYDNAPEWGYCAAEGCDQEAMPLWLPGEWPDDPELLLCPKHLGLLIGSLEADVAALREALQHAARMKTIKGARMVAGDALSAHPAHTALLAELHAARAVVELARDERTTAAQLAAAVANYDAVRQGRME